MNTLAPEPAGTGVGAETRSLIPPNKSPVCCCAGGAILEGGGNSPLPPLAARGLRPAPDSDVVRSLVVRSMRAGGGELRPP